MHVRCDARVSLARPLEPWPSGVSLTVIPEIQTRTLVQNLLGPYLFRSRRTSRVLLLLLLWAAEASASSRISLLPFEGDRPRPLRWRVAYVLKRAGHVVLGYAPPADRSSISSLREYADRRNVDVFVSGTSADTPRGWELSLRFRGADGKALGQPLTFRAENLRGLLIELKSEGPSKLDRAVRGNSPSAVAQLPPGRALPLPTRRAAPLQPKSNDRPVLPGAEAEQPAAAPARRKPKEIDLDAAIASRAQSWDADSADDPSAAPPADPPSRLRAKEDPATARAARSHAAKERAAKQRAALQRLALGANAAPSKASGSAGGSGAIDLDADTRGALEETVQRKTRPEPPGSDSASDALADTSSDANPSTAAEPAAESTEIESMDTPAADPEPEPKPKKKKGGLFAGRLQHTNSSSGSEAPAGSASPVDDAIADRGLDGAKGGAHARPPLAVVGASAGYLHRAFTYSDDLYNRLRAPTTNGWVYRFDAAFYPFAQPLKEKFALFASYEGALAGTVQDSRTNRTYGVKFSDIEGGARYRQPLGEHELGIQATVGQLTAGLDESSSVTGVPEISYLSLSPAVDLSLNFGAVSLRAALAYQHSLGGFGEMSTSDWFPHMEGYGFDGQLGVEYHFSPSVTFQASGVLRRFVLDMNSRPEDAIEGQAEVAAGAVDQYLSGYLGMRFTL
jgi:hypothetical protein